MERTLRPGMNRILWILVAASFGLGLAGTDRPARGEDLAEAWGIALRVNAGLQSQQDLTVAQGFNLRSARSSRWPTVRTFTFDSLLTVTPGISTTSFLGPSAGGRGGPGGTGGGGSGSGARASSLF